MKTKVYGLMLSFNGNITLNMNKMKSFNLDYKIKKLKKTVKSGVVDHL